MMNRNYYIFWTLALVVFTIPQVFTAIAYTRLADHLDKPLKTQVVKFRP